jgi:hypothetical protein
MIAACERGGGEQRFSRTCGFWLVACALALRRGIAPGFMPVASADGFMIAMYSGQSVTGVNFGKTDPAMLGDHGCAFASLVVATAPDLPIAATPVVVRIVRSPPVGARRRAPQPSVRQP